MLVILRFYTPQVEGASYHSPMCDCLAPEYHLHLFQPGHSFHCDLPLFHSPLASLATLDLVQHSQPVPKRCLLF